MPGKKAKLKTFFFRIFNLFVLISSSTTAPIIVYYNKQPNPLFAVRLAFKVNLFQDDEQYDARTAYEGPPGKNGKLHLFMHV